MPSAWMIRAECGVPRSHYVNSANGRAVAEGCAQLDAVAIAAASFVVSLALLLLHLFGPRQPAGVGADPMDDDGEAALQARGPEPPLVPLWVVPLPFLLGAAGVGAAPRVAAKTFDVTKAAWDSSEMSKVDYVQMAVAGERLKAQAANAIRSSGIISGTGVVNAYLARRPV